MKKPSGKTEIIRHDTIENANATYVYSLITRDSKRVASYGIPLYSIRIEMTYDGVRTEAETGEIFADLGKATVFYERLRDNLAMPSNLPYILEDSITV